jgi:branched-chain amino acid transport system substrate-binding protein
MRKLNHHSTITAGVAALTVVLVAACSTATGGSGDTDTTAASSTDESVPTGASENEYVIGVWGPTETVQGEGIVQGATLAADELNEDAGIAGMEVRIISEDSEGNPDGAVTVVQRLLSSDIDAMVGGFLTGEVLAIVDAVADAQIPYINPGASSMSIQQHVADDYERYKYLFRIGVNVQHLAEESCHYLESVGIDYGATHVGIIYDDRQWTEELRPFLLDCIEGLGLPVSLSGYDPSATDFSANFFELTGEGADWLIALSAASEGIIVTQQWGELEVQAPLTGFIAEAQEAGFLDATNGAGAYAGPFWQAAVPGVEITSETTAFLEAYQERFGESPIYNSFGAYEGVHMLAEAVETAGTTDADAVVEALENLDFEGVYGQVQFNDTHERHHPDAARPLGVQLMPDGERLILTGPEGIETTEFQSPPWIEGGE